MSTRLDTSRRPETLNLARRIGYRLLPGEGFSYILHMRPREWPIMVAHTTVGFLLATGWNTAAIRENWGVAVAGIALWVLALNGGTLAINSAFDNDDGDIGYLDAPPKPPRHLAAFSIGLMAAGQLLALFLPPLFAIAYAVCFVMSILYSVPPFRWKAVAGADWIINMWGFGTFTPLAGWALTGRSLEPWAILVLLAFCPLFAAFYPLTQLYQFEEDQRRGDRTLALVLGMRRSLIVSNGCAVLAFVLFGAAYAFAPVPRAWPALAVAAAAWFMVLVPWLRRHPTMSPEEHQRGMYAALRAWAVTDIAVLISFT